MYIFITFIFVEAVHSPNRLNTQTPVNAQSTHGAMVLSPVDSSPVDFS